MTENDNGTYNNEACTKNSSKDKSLQEIVYEITEDELSRFPDDTVTVEQLKRMAENQSLRRKRRRKKIIAAAAVFFVALAGILIGFSDFPANVEADKNEPEEIVTEDGVVIEDGGWGSSSEDELIITDWDEVELARKYVSQLMIPTSLPDGYVFKELNIESQKDAGNTCTFLYENGNELLEIYEYIPLNNLNSIEISDFEHKADTELGTVYFNTTEGIKTAIIQNKNDGMIIVIKGELYRNDIISIINTLK